MGLNYNLTPIQTCAIVALVCGIWNLFGDICFLDFSLAYMNFDGEFGAINDVAKSGNLFDFENNDWPVLFSQAGGWMYPIWAVVTVYPLYLGLEAPPGAGDGGRNSVFPCAVLAYGLCIVGGNLHAGYAFSTVLPKILQEYQSDDNGNDLYSIMSLAQTKIMDCYVFGYTPGPLAIMVASGWIMYIVIKKETKFPRWFALCTPLVTLVWVGLVGFLLLPWPLGFYFAGSFGTWIILVMNVAASWVLWDVKAEITLVSTGLYQQMID